MQVTPTGSVRVNDRLEYDCTGCLGDWRVRRKPAFTHASLDDFRIIRENLAGGDRRTTDRLMPSALFTDPQVAHIGLTEAEAQRQGILVRVAKLPMLSVLRTRTTSETKGFMKALIAQG